MSETTNVGDSTKWNVGFFARRLPLSHWIRGPDFCVFRLPNDARKTLLQIAEEHRELFEFAWRSLERDICLIVIRITGRNEPDVAETARHRIGHYIDGLNLVLEDAPQIAKTLIIQRSGEPDASFREFQEKGWMRLVPKNKDDLKLWEASRQKLFERLWPFFVTMLENDWKRYSELFQQLLYSARLFRRASETASYGLEYLCKWVALEALVVAGSTTNKGALAADRISSLFPKNREAIRTEVRDLWQRRHVIAHEAKAEFFDEADVDQVFQIYIPRLDYLNTAVTLFAVDNLKAAATVSDLWRLAENWTLPEDIVAQRPPTASLIAATKILLNRHVEWPGIGPTLDAELAVK